MKLHNSNLVRSNPDWRVWVGEDPATREKFLVKESDELSPYRPTLTARLLDEYKFLDQFRHPHLLRPAAFDAAAGRSTWAEVQCDLVQYLDAHGPVPPTLVANVLAAAADALGHLHTAGFGHGAVGPASLFVTPVGTVAFADFLGYAFRSTAPLPVPDPEPKYQAPELIDSAAGAPGPASDLYCLGYLGLELLTGGKFAQLFGVADGANWLAWHADPHKQLADWKQTLGHAPDGLLEVIAGLIGKRPADRRFQSAAQLKGFLEKSRLTSDTRLPPYRRAAANTPRVRLPRPPVPDGPRRALPAKISGKPTLTLARIDGVGDARKWSPRAHVLIGHAARCDLRCHGRGVSPKHALAACGQDGVWRVFDLGTVGTTFVNGAAVRRARLHPNDELYIGGVGLRVGLDYAPLRIAFDQFELTARLHAGGRGTVYRGTWAERGGRAVAVRVFPKRFPFDATGLRRLLRGVPQASLVRHPHLARVYRAGVKSVKSRRVWFLATEYFPRGTLRDKLRSFGRLKPADAVGAVRDAAAGAQAIADQGLVHRVVNPSCVFLGEGGAKLGDFYFARPLGAADDSPATEFGEQDVSDLVYQAPECVRGDGRLTPACDVYSLGATLYEALAGRPPVDPGRPPLAVCEQILSGSVVPLSDAAKGVPAGVAEVVMRALRRDPADRFRDPGELAAALAGV